MKLTQCELAKPRSTMPAELKAQWLADLRSGKYPQGRRQLQDQYGGYCCLGVLQLSAGDTDVERYKAVYRPDASTAKEYPSIEWLQSHNISFRGPQGEIDVNPWLPSLFANAGNANDSGTTFLALADAIEKDIDGV